MQKEETIKNICKFMSNLRYNKMYFLKMFDGFLPPQEFSYFVTTEFCIRPPAKGASGHGKMPRKAC